MKNDIQKLAGGLIRPALVPSAFGLSIPPTDH